MPGFGYGVTHLVWQNFGAPVTLGRGDGTFTPNMEPATHGKTTVRLSEVRLLVCITSVREAYSRMSLISPALPKIISFPTFKPSECVWTVEPLRPRNLTASPALKKALFLAHVRGLSPSARSQIHGPAKGRTYYGSVGHHQYAIATFISDKYGSQDQPELFARVDHGVWIDRGDTGGCISATVIPSSMLTFWGFKPKSSTGPCYG